ncbi:hypothetical protein ACIQXF_02880 [Lysinibacillus sp. NPDC097231]|uniref:hypothetical protein n=1 Tax=Lysinibacillus sp. NPDC097231 TaxID=3364142 RepID=UPI00380255F5
MLSEAGKLSFVPFTRNYRKNPLTSLTVSLHIFENVDAILLTHRHGETSNCKLVPLSFTVTSLLAAFALARLAKHIFTAYICNIDVTAK